MNLLWLILFCGSITLFLFQDPNMFLSSATTSIYDSLKICFTLGGIYIFWLGIIQIVQDSGLAQKISKLLSPFIRFLFGNISKEQSELISLNLSANLLGLGNAGLSAGLRAMESLSNNKDLKQSGAMLFALNCCSIQILPSTVILLRSEAGSGNSSDVILPILIVSIICFCITVFFVKMFFRDN